MTTFYCDCAAVSTACSVSSERNGAQYDGAVRTCAVGVQPDITGVLVGSVGVCMQSRLHVYIAAAFVANSDVASGACCAGTDINRFVDDQIVGAVVGQIDSAAITAIGSALGCDSGVEYQAAVADRAAGCYVNCSAVACISGGDVNGAAVQLDIAPSYYRYGAAVSGSAAFCFHANQSGATTGSDIAGGACGAEVDLSAIAHADSVCLQ